MVKHADSSGGVRRPALLAAFALALAALSALAAWQPGGADSAPIKSLVLGSSSVRHRPDCGSMRTLCSAEGRVTAVISSGSGLARRNAYASPWKGKVVAWSISLSRPYNKVLKYKNGEIKHQDEVSAFDSLFGKPASARISILKRVAKGKKVPRYKLVRQSPTEILNPYFGTEVHFVLDHPLTVMPKQVVALTIPTWAPAFWHNPDCDVDAAGNVIDQAGCDAATQANRWRASRPKDGCSPKSASQSAKLDWAQSSRPQQKVGSVKAYGCRYAGSLLLYTATVVRPS